MATQYFREYKTLTFLPKVVDGEIELRIVTREGSSEDEEATSEAAPDLLVDPRDVVQDNIDYQDPAGTDYDVKTVTIRVEDDGDIEMRVYSPSVWAREPSVSSTRSEYIAAIPGAENDPPTIVPMLIVALDNDEVVARRSQTVIIKHRQGA